MPITLVQVLHVKGPVLTFLMNLAALILGATLVASGGGHGMSDDDILESDVSSLER
jgi:hypothetical protein